MKTPKRQRNLATGQKRSTKSTVDSDHWVMTWFKSIFLIVFVSWVDLNQNSGKFFEPWVDLNQNILEAFWVASRFCNQNILEAFWVVSRFESNFRNPFWVVSWFESNLVRPLLVMSWFQSKLSETELNRIKSRTHVSVCQIQIVTLRNPMNKHDC